MATLYITEYAEVHIGLGGRVGQIPVEPPLVEQTVAIGGSSVQSSAFNAQTQFVRVEADSICSVLFGISPVALSTSGRFAANQTEYRAVPRGGALKVAVITNV